MKTLKLDVDALRVASFEVAEREEPAAAPEAYSYNTYCTYPRASCLVACPSV